MRLIRLSLFLVLVISSPNFAAINTATAQQRVKTSTLEVRGLRDTVTVRRDERGIPYITAENESDLYLAQGYITASDRLWQMDLLRRTARGELSEIFGRSTLDQDKQQRQYGFAALSEAMVARLPPPVRAALDSYAKGVNIYIESLSDTNTPPEFRILQYKPRSWTAADSLIASKIFASALSQSWRTDLVREAFTNLSTTVRDEIFPEISPLDVLIVGTDSSGQTRRQASSGNYKPATLDELREHLSMVQQVNDRLFSRIGLHLENRAASNGWVISGRHTASGKPMLANDPHLSPSAPAIWYMINLNAPGVHVSGVTIPSVPGVILGHNEQIAWGVTNLSPDVQDLYVERFDEKKPSLYLTPAGWREAEIRHEEIRVRRSPIDTTTETVNFDVTVTRHGPIILNNANKRYALRWTALDPNLLDFQSFYELNRARNWKEFRIALRDFTCPGQNFIYADIYGHIGYSAAGRVPIRKTGDGTLPYDGSTDAGEWISYVPFDKMPYVLDPPSGIIVTANNRVVGLDYPYYLTHEWSEPHRAWRIHDLLSAKQRLTVEDFSAIQGDTYSVGDAIFTREVVKLARPLASSTPEFQAMVDLFDGWDAHSSAESRIMPIAAVMRNRFGQRVLGEKIGPELLNTYAWANFPTFIDHIITKRPKEWLPREFKRYEDLILTVYRDALAELSKYLGQDKSQWTWGRFGQLNFSHPLAGIPVVGAQFKIPPYSLHTGGSGTTVNAGAFASMRIIADLSDWDHTRQNITLGESGNPASPHWTDQLLDLRSNTLRPFPFSKVAVAKSATEILTLKP